MRCLNKDFSAGIIRFNPIFILLLGLCPALAVSTSLDNAIGMTAAATFVLLGSNIIIAVIRQYVPKQVRIPVFIVIIATLVTIVDLLLQGFAPALSAALGIFIPLIVVNCMILGRAEAFASKQGVSRSIMDALGVGIGFGWALALISLIRQLLGTGSLSFFGQQLLTIPGLVEEPAIIFLFPMGAFFVVGLLLALFKWLEAKK
ncbi:electron transport complex subunit RsxE [Candidatus Acetothermia bacterium]|jgi:electron transport complex protein RnfE|nr:electron transport complex subunit RsxE [Candidatus Acetothermia bacterium]MCI2427649.1 electron transport complex subunit RsxE [Candidatus Acetothermia bacterium]MCI2428834.1 electron transport complex subunit RsxE [Candidatus Acetothermia bacterium]